MARCDAMACHTCVQRQIWALAAPEARATNELFLSQIYQAELALRLEAPAGDAVLAATRGSNTFSVLLEVPPPR